MLKHLSITVVIIVLFFPYTYADIGCKSGNFIYTVATGATYNNGSDVLPVYAESSAVRLRTWNEDPQCGFLKSKADNYLSPMGTGSNPNSKCSHSGALGDISTLVIYSQSDNNCNVPLDDLLPFLIIVSIFSAIWIMRKGLKTSDN